MYRAVTRNIRVTVTPSYLPSESDPRRHRYVWAYRVEIVNMGPEVVQLIERHWEITDETGHREEVRGPGVVGEQPVLGPGATFEYTSACPLATPSGVMVGHYGMVSEDGETFWVAIPAFSLDSEPPRRMN